MAVTAQSVLDRVQQTLQDTGGIRWSSTAELILWVNDAQREIALLKPDATATNTTVTLAAGTKQTIPAGGNRLLNVVRNMSAASSGTGKRTVRLVSRDILDSLEPSWHDPAVKGDAKHGTSVKHFMYEDQDPRNFYVYPGVSGNAYLEIIYSENPATVAANGNLGVPDIYATAIMHYVLYMCYMKDTEFVANQQRAGSHFNLFMSSVTGKSQIDMVTSPNANATPQAQPQLSGVG